MKPLKAGWQIAIQVPERGQTVAMALANAVGSTEGVKEEVRALTQALSEILFLYRHVLGLITNRALTPESPNRDLTPESRDHDQVAMEVTDTGPGIAPEHQDKVLKRFYRVDKGRGGTGGVGLGLAIARRAVESNGGTLDLVQSSSEGSMFRILLSLDRVTSV